MDNRDTAATWAYHDGTKHSFASVRANVRTLDWENQPVPYKLYADLPPLALPRADTPTVLSAVGALDGTKRPPGEPAAPTLASLATLLHGGAGIVRRVVYADGREQYFRAAPTTGALYHVDLYLVCTDLPGLAAGVYHFGPHDFALRQLRPGDQRAHLVAAAAAEPAVTGAPAVLVLASTFWRNAWKYEARAYRHAYWDGGTMTANLLAMAAALDLPARVVLGFADDAVNALLGLDGGREAALALLSIGAGAPAPPETPPLAPLALTVAPETRGEIAYEAITAMHAASALHAPVEVAAWRAAGLAAELPPAAELPATALRLRPRLTRPSPDLPGVIRRRGSTRRFTQAPIGFSDLSLLLHLATRPLATDYRPAGGAPLVEPWVIVHAVEDVPPGAYRYDAARTALVPIRRGDFRREAAVLDLGQDLAGDASVNLYLLADLAPLLARLGNRGYRAAQLEGGIAGGRLYLAATALGLGATGLTFFDDDVTAFFGPEAAGRSVMFLVAAGVPRRARRAGESRVG